MTDRSDKDRQPHRWRRNEGPERALASSCCTPSLPLTRLGDWRAREPTDTRDGRDREDRDGQRSRGWHSYQALRGSDRADRVDRRRGGYEREEANIALPPPPCPRLPPSAPVLLLSGRRFPAGILEEARAQGLDFSPLLIGPSSLFSTLLPRFYGQVRAMFASQIPPGNVTRIIDATSNMGGDVLLFRDLYPEAVIDAVELDEPTFACLQANTSTPIMEQVLRRALPCGSVVAHHADCVEFLRHQPAADFVYFDPPWGGTEYHQRAIIPLKLSGEAIGTLAGRVLHTCAPVVVLKAPVNADMTTAAADLATVVGHTVPCVSLDVLKPVPSAIKGPVAFRLHFFRRAHIEPDAK